MNKFGYVIVFVSDMDKSIAFYRDVLGFPVKEQSHKWTELDTGQTTLALHLAEAGEHAHTHATMPAGHFELGLTVPDFAAFHKEMVAKGVRCIQPPKKQDFGTLATYADPDGLAVSVSDAT